MSIDNPSRYAPTGDLHPFWTSMPDSPRGGWENRMLVRGLRNLDKVSAKDELVNVRCPVLLIGAMKDDMIAVDEIRTAAGRLAAAGSRYLQLDCGHYDPYVMPLFDANIGAQIEFIREVVADVPTLDTGSSLSLRDHATSSLAREELLGMNRTDHEIKLRDGRTLAYAQYGDAHGRPIIHCHGTPSSRVEGELTFSGNVAAELGLRIVVPDRPGIGQSDFQQGRRIIDWPDDVLDLVDALEFDTFAVLGSSGGGPYATVCGARMPTRVRMLGLLGAVAPLDVPDALVAMSAPLRFMLRLARLSPALLRGLFRLNLRAISGGGTRAGERMAASFPEPDRTLLQQHPEIRDGFVACFVEACRNGTRGAAADLALMARPWGFDPADIEVPVRLWHGERDRNVPAAHGRYLAGVLPQCRATFYPDEAHLSLPRNHQREILSALVG